MLDTRHREISPLRLNHVVHVELETICVRQRATCITCLLTDKFDLYFISFYYTKLVFLSI